MLVSRYVHKMVFRILDAADPSPELVSNRNAMIEKLQKAWIKASKGFEKEWKAYAAEFKKAQKAKKEPPTSLLSKVNKLVKTISTYCKDCAKLYQKLISGNPTKAEQQKVGIAGKIAEIPKGVDKNKLARMVKTIPVDFVVEETKLLSALKKELDQYYDVQTQTLKTPVGVAITKPGANAKATLPTPTEKPKSNTAPTLNKLYSDLKAAADAAWKLAYQEVKKVKPSGYERLKEKALRLMAPFKDIINSSSSLSFHVNGGSDGIHTPEYPWVDFNNFMLKTYGVNLDTASDDKEYKVLSNIRKSIQALARDVGDVVYFMNLYAADNAKQGNSQPKPSTSGGSTSSSKSSNTVPSTKEPQASSSEISEGADLLKDLEFSAKYAIEFAEIANERSESYHRGYYIPPGEGSGEYALEAARHMSFVLKILPQRGRFQYTPAISSSELLDGLAKRMGVSIEKAKAIFTSGKNAQQFKSTLSKMNSAREWLDKIDKKNLIP